MSDEATYDYATHKWSAKCPHGDVCSGCDALGYCTRMEANAFDALTTEAALKRPTPKGLSVEAHAAALARNEGRRRLGDDE